MRILNTIKRLSQKEAFLLSSIFITALSLRLALALFKTQLYSDDLEYHNMAIDILQGKGFASGVRHPAYPFFLAFVYMLTNAGILAAKITQSFLGAFAAVLVYLVSKSIFNKWHLALVSGLAAAFYPFFILYASRLFSENLQIFIVLAVFLFVLRDFDKPSLKNKIFIGILFGLSILVKAVVLPFLPILLIWMSLFSREVLKKRLKGIIIISSLAVMTLAPWVIRNYAVYKQFVLASNLGGACFWASNNPEISDTILKGIQATPPLYTEQMKSDMAGLSPVQQDRYLYRTAFNNIRNDPKKFIWFGALKMKTLWHLWPDDPKKVKVYSMDKSYPEFSFLKNELFSRDSLIMALKILFHLCYNIFFIGMFLGLYFSFRNRYEMVKVLLLFLFICLMSCVIIFTFYPGVRYRLFLDPYVFILGGYGIFNVASRLNKYLKGGATNV